MHDVKGHYWGNLKAKSSTTGINKIKQNVSHDSVGSYLSIDNVMRLIIMERVNWYNMCCLLVYKLDCRDRLGVIFKGDASSVLEKTASDEVRGILYWTNQMQ